VISVHIVQTVPKVQAVQNWKSFFSLKSANAFKPAAAIFGFPSTLPAVATPATCRYPLRQLNPPPGNT
jgi:hypothetical protein